jgi:ABC-type sugar transport system permease subunit
MGTYVFKTAFGSFNWAYGSALATAMLVMIFSVSLIANRVMLRETIEY